MASSAWNTIEENYNKALRYLVPPDEASAKITSDSRVAEWRDVNTGAYWQKDELHGLQYLLLAYNAAVKQEEKNHLLFARILMLMLMYGKEASNRKQEIDRQHYTIPNQRPKDKHCGKI